MALWTVREHVITMSGRADLGTNTGVVGTSADLGMNTFINMAQRFLDQRITFRRGMVRLQKDIAEGDYTLNYLYARAVKRVWVADGEERTELEKAPREELLGYYADPEADLDTDRPKYYAPNFIMLTPEQKALTSATYDTQFSYEQGDLVNVTDTATAYDLDGIIFFPPADGTYTMIIEGLFFSPTLSANTDKSYWTERFPEALEYATLYMLESFYRNTEGAKDWLNALDTLLRGHSCDVVEEEITNVTQMKG